MIKFKEKRLDMGKESKADKYFRELTKANADLVTANNKIEAMHLQAMNLEQKLLQSTQQFKNFALAMKSSIGIFEDGCKEFNEEVDNLLLNRETL
jgi:hypothetical protein